jgi:branched-chain amino acid transport system ATP-binding protein
MGLLVVHDLTVRFGGLTAVEGVDFAVEPRQIVSIIGPNGAGKTTVFNAITGIYEPTAGTIMYHGRPLDRPLTWRVLALGALIGLVTGLTAALLSVDVNALWRATIKRNFAGPGEPFSYRAAWDDARNYLRGAPALDRMRGGRWAVRTADGRLTLGYAKDVDAARSLRARFAQLIELASEPTAHEAVHHGDGAWSIRTPNGDTLATFDDEPAARATIDRFAELSEQSARRRRRAAVALALGIVVGFAGTWAVWSRSRRSPEVISRAGIARTFQNIRLFQNTSAVDNVLVGMDRSLAGGIVRMALRLPGLRAAERAARCRAGELLSFVGLSGRDSTLAKNLPYGDQRRLEIARALATDPQLILLDEPAAGMNPAEAVDLNGLIERIRARGIAVLLIEHHMKVVMGISDRIAVLEYGRKIAEGTAEQVRSDPRVIAAYLGSEEVT